MLSVKSSISVLQLRGESKCRVLFKKNKTKKIYSVATVPWWGRRWLQFLRLAVFGFCVWRRIGVLGLLLLRPHVCIQASLEKQLLVSWMERKGVTWSWVKKGMCRMVITVTSEQQVNKAHLPSSFSDPAVADNQNLVCSDYGGQPFIFNKKKKIYFLKQIERSRKNENLSDKKTPTVLPVSYNNCCTVGTDFSQRGLDVAFCLRVQSRCGLQRDIIC